MLWRTGLLVAILQLIGGCSGDQFEGPYDLRDLLYPSGPALIRNFALIEAETGRCMEEQALEYRQRELSDESARVKFWPRLGTLDLVEAEESGFFATPISTPTIDPNAELLEDMSEDEIRIIIEARMECSVRAKEVVNGAYQDEIAPLRAEYQAHVKRFEAEPDVLALNAKWSECMGASGLLSSTFETFPEFTQRYAEDYGFSAYAEDRRQAAMEAAKCAEPLQEDYNLLWLEYQLTLEGFDDIPQIPT